MPEPRALPGSEEIRDGFSDLLNATFGVIGDLAKRTAEATVPPTREIPGPAPGAPPLNVAVHYGVATATNVLGLLGSSLRDAYRPGTPSPRPADTAAPTGRGPGVRAGGTLRIPLSIENPADEPMQRFAATVLAVRYRGGADGIPLAVDAVRLEPETLTIASKDFEKLTVFVRTVRDTAPGPYEALIALGDSPHETTVRFDVTSDDDAGKIPADDGQDAQP
jgi:hypothetical protein